MTEPEDQKIEYRRVGNSGLKVSVPILGTMGLGSKLWLPWCVDEAASLEVLKAAYDLGINTWDTANTYSNGESERIVGKAVREFKIPRDKLVIMTKCYCAVGDELGMQSYRMPELKFRKDYVNRLGLSRKAIFSEVNASLERLGLDYIDLLQIHRCDPETPPEETMEALHDLVKSGKVRYIGASSMWTWQFCLYQQAAERNNWTKFISMQNQYSLAYREEERDMIPYCRATGVGIIPWAPLARGQLTRLPTAETNSERNDMEKRYQGAAFFAVGSSEVDKRIISRIGEVADKKGWTMAEVALAWILGKDTTPIVGISKVDRVTDMVGLKGKGLNESEVEYLEELYVPREISGHV
ncbi:Aldo/keto reductase [Tuber magnatum]|uniref:Aldo/keto reductase n=1 Tax=Tuber magnatum TaxID=42249 RepID=A0A317SGC7_9PEZI|nr:Aldo/keto reductase [Tuber magnatum]